MRGLKMTAAAVALVGIGGFGTAVLRAQESDALREAIAAQQEQTLEAAGAEVDSEAVAQDLLPEEALDALVAPVALYPDALLAQVLVAAAFPLQVAKADQLIDASTDMGEDELMDALEQQQFDPSVLVLMSGFPTVVSRMANDLDWTDRLGRAMLAQDADVLAAVQRMRMQADAAGNLTDNEAQVVERDDGQIYIEPADPEVIYVPSYDPEVVYSSRSFAPATSYGGPMPRPYMSSQSYTTPYTPGPTYAVPSTSSNPLANPLTAGALAFGGALLVTELFGDDDDDDDNNKNKNGWDDYWRSDRPIDWRDRQVYARPGSYYGSERASWSRERDRFWDHRTRDWRRDDAEAIRAYQAGRQDTMQQLQRSDKRAERIREAAREERARAEVRRERLIEQRQDAAVQREKAETAAERQRRKEAAEAEARREARREKAAEQARVEEHAKKKAQQQRAAARQEEQAKAAADARKQEAAKQARAEEQARKARQEAKAEEDSKKARQQARAEEQAKQARQEARAERQAAEEQQAKAARQKAQEQKAAEARKAARQAAKKCEEKPNAKGCKGN